jgi:hypothetical protein
MTEDPKAPNLSEPSGNELPENERPAFESPPEQKSSTHPVQDDSFRAGEVQSISDETNERPREMRNASGLLRRITGSLRRATGSLGGAFSGRESPARPPAGRSQNKLRQDLLGETQDSNTPAAKGSAERADSDDMLRMTGYLSRSAPEMDLRGELRDNDVAPSDQAAEPPRETPEREIADDQELDARARRMSGSLQRLTGPLEPTGQGQPPLEERPVIRMPDERPAQEIPQERELEIPSRRMTGAFRRDTGPLGTKDEDTQGAEDQAGKGIESAPGPKGTGELTPPTVDASAGGDLLEPKPDDRLVESKERPTTTLVRRITGSLKRVTGSLGRGAKKESSAEAEQKEAERRRLAGDEYVSEIRQDLASQESDRIERPRRTGLIGALTGGFRRMTGALGFPSQESQPELPPITPLPELEAPPEIEPEASEAQTQIEDVLLADRLAVTAPSEPPTWAEPEDMVIEIATPETETPEISELPTVTPETLGDQPVAEADLTGVEPISLLESGAVAAIEQAEEKARQESVNADWMAEIRQEAAEEEAGKGGEERPEKQKRTTGSLQDFITSILRPEEKQTPASEEPIEVSDDLVTGRLGLELNTETAEVEATLADTAPLNREGFDFSMPEDAAQAVAQDFTEEDDQSFLDKFQARFDQVSAGAAETAQPPAEFAPKQPSEEEEAGQELSHFVPYQPLEPKDTGQLFTISPEDEKLLWGEQHLPEAPQETPTIPDQYWDALRAEVQPEKPESGEPAIPDDAYAQAYLTGKDYVPGADSERSRVKKVTGNIKREVALKPFEDIRSVLLEDYQAAEQEAPTRIARPEAAPLAEAGEGLEDFEAGEFGVKPLETTRPKNLREWLASRTALQKIILVEIVLIVLALLIVIPFLIVMLIRGPQGQGLKSPLLVPNSLPANVPYPSGLTLPGGWQFTLDKSTFVDGQWKPAKSEWLEGTELRRVVALPWNPQTEAVVKTFQQGDPVDLNLTNNDVIHYKVDQVQRVPVSDSSILSGTKPSLAIILYQESAQERWVVVCNR